jgi:hypothetical protein
VSIDAATGGILLTWTGGQPAFTISRSTDPRLVQMPGSEIGITSDRTWLDFPPANESLIYYDITSPCVYAPPEVCDGVDNDCNGEIDEGFGLGGTCVGTGACGAGMVECNGAGGVRCSTMPGGSQDQSQPETCDGLDNDCDGTADEPGTETTCNLAHASATCANGACQIAQCDVGYGDCNSAAQDGCEINTHIAQSTSPYYLWAGDPNPNKDLQQGYQRVTSIANCGACGNVDPSASCDDGIACTTDLCVPLAGVGVCRHYSRSQCSEARCGSGPLPAGTPPPRDPGCTGLDADGDGLPGDWESSQVNPYDSLPEQAGVDLNCNGVIDDSDDDLIWHEPPTGDYLKDIYLKYDYMAAGPSESSSHQPLPESVDQVVAAFARRGIALHVAPAPGPIPHTSVVYLPVQGPDICAAPGNTSFYDLKAAHFDQKLRVGYHYLVFSHKSCCDDSGAANAGGSGLAEIHGNDSLVSLAVFQIQGTVTQIKAKRKNEEAGTILHEMGHNLGLCHDGGVDPNSPGGCPVTEVLRKPNHISSMNGLFQLGGILRAGTSGTLSPLDPNLPRRVDFSHLVTEPLDELALQETTGLNIGTAPFDRDVSRYFCQGSGEPVMGSGSGPVDWDCNGSISPAPVTVDLNLDGAYDILEGRDEWGGLRFDFQCQPTYADSVLPPQLVARGELTAEQADGLHLRAGATSYCDPGYDDCDGLAANGCETPVFNDPDNCGGCGQVCSGDNISRSCHAGTCNGACLPGYDDCNGDKRTDGCETSLLTDPSSCGACGASCAPAGDTCQGGVCGCGGGEACDALFCSLGASCSGGACSGGTPRDCGAGSACSVGSCNEAANRCDMACTALPCWSTPVDQGSGSAPSNDTAFNPSGAQSYQYIAKGTKLYAFRNADDAMGPAGSIKWQWNAPAAMQNFPAPVPLSSGGNAEAESIFIGADDGFVYKLDAADGSVKGSADTRRAGCPSDKVMGTPAVQLYRYSNTSFQQDVDSHPGHMNDDLIYVITSDSCSDRTNNRILAYWRSNLTLKWVYNGAGASMLDAGTEGCSIDYAGNTLYCGTSLAAEIHQNSLWAINTITGSLRWSSNAGSIKNRPILHTGSHGTRLYVANAAGTLQAYDPTGGAAGGALPLWTQPIIMPGGISRDIWAESRAGGYQDRIFLVDDTGVVTAVDDEGSRGVTIWSAAAAGGAQFNSMPVVSPSSKVLVGRSDGYLQQIDAGTGASEGTVSVGTGSGAQVFDPGLDTVPGAAGLNRLTIASGSGPVGSLVQQFCVPVAGGTGGGCVSDAQCAAFNGPCALGRCETGSGVCYSQPRPDGLPCNDGAFCTPTSTCMNGACVADNYSSCSCVSPGDRACPAGATCCGGAAGCVNVFIDANNCGDCGNICAAGQICVQGHCERDTNSCGGGSTTAAMICGKGAILTGLDAIDLEHTSTGACSAYVTTYATTGASSVMKISPSGLVTSVAISTPSEGPMHGVGVPPAGNTFFASMVNTATGGTPGMVMGTMSPESGSRVIDALPTSGTGPFTDTRLDRGPVGPAIDLTRYALNPSLPEVYFGNWQANGDLYRVSRTCTTCAWTTTPVLWTHVSGDRVTAIAFAARSVTGAPVRHRFIILGHGSVLSLIDLDISAQTDLQLSSRVPPISSILGLTTDPVYGDVYVLARESGPTTKTHILVVRPHDNSVHDLRDVHAVLKVPPQLPQWFTVEGLINASSAVILEMMTPVIGMPPSGCQDITLVP